MDYSRLVRLNQGLLTETALLAVASIVAGWLPNPVGGLIANLTSGVAANNLGTLIDRLLVSGSRYLDNSISR